TDYLAQRPCGSLAALGWVAKAMPAKSNLVVGGFSGCTSPTRQLPAVTMPLRRRPHATIWSRAMSRAKCISEACAVGGADPVGEAATIAGVRSIAENREWWLQWLCYCHRTLDDAA